MIDHTNTLHCLLLILATAAVTGFALGVYSMF